MTPYLKKRTLFPKLIEAAPASDLSLICVIPAYDEPHLIDSLQSLRSCRPPRGSVEVIVVVNHSESEEIDIKVRNRETFEQAKKWSEQGHPEWLRYHVLYIPDLPAKHAGVGTARKIGMDEACRRLEAVGRPDGILLGFDADSSCDPNYFAVIETYFQSNSRVQAAGIYFEHPLEGTKFDASVYRAITAYELHLRYFINAQAWAGLPFAFQTIGSSMAVRCRSYQQQGGMNRRKAGEDFYFLHKFIKLGCFGVINATRVIPSPRPSHRVPFGTGRAVGQLLEQEVEADTYSPAGFIILKQFIQQVPKLYDADNDIRMDPLLASFLDSVKLRERLQEMRRHTGSRSAFYKRFFRWFDAFMLMKYVHFVRDRQQPNVPITEAVRWLTEISGYGVEPSASEEALLQLWRNIDREAPNT